MRRLSLHQARACAGTPLYNLGWLKQEIFDAALEVFLRVARIELKRPRLEDVFIHLMKGQTE